MKINSEINFDIKNLTSFKIGGKIKKVYFPTNLEEFEQILHEYPNIKVFGNLSNTLISSDGFDGAIILTTKMDSVLIEGTKVIADAGVKGPKLSQTVCEKGLSGFEFMIGFPGSVGGEICMNASANEQAISDKLVSITCFQPEKGIVKFKKSEMEFDYRTSRCQKENLIVLQAEFELETQSKEVIKTKMNENLAFRKAHQPSLVLPNCGSIFKNPQGDSAGRLLDSIGAKNFSVGGVKVWENHANFIVNYNKGTSTDVLNLMNQMYSKVKEKYNIELNPEIRFLGGNNKEENELCKILKIK
uniref:UDP-N-acetylenolpyruvoylglucosamine reductase n=1 Tax=uncultured Candidatus Melainabacteria bacterium TaxID=2682970 RepID=A0A650EL34_9BACT|nr:UDP-N-acetylenolpyruvoylglucosamine reductase [uncultured Candidatus Melainabacteria bacterium]